MQLSKRDRSHSPESPSPFSDHGQSALLSKDDAIIDNINQV